MCPLGPGCHERSRGRLLRSLGAHSFCPECLENASVRLDPTTESPEEPEIAKDISESSRTAKELQHLKEGLEKWVSQRTAELQHMNEMPRESESRYRNVVEDQTEFIVRWLPQGIYTFVNQSYCRYFDRSSEELIGSTFFPTVHEEDLEAVEK